MTEGEGRGNEEDTLYPKSAWRVEAGELEYPRSGSAEALKRRHTYTRAQDRQLPIKDIERSRERAVVRQIILLHLPLRKLRTEINAAF
jgi:hypothetical protein